MNDDDARLIRSSSVMGLGTIVSRVTGLVRNLLLVAALGTGILGDAYNVANTTPNILYNLLIGGALSAVFVPQISDVGRAPHPYDRPPRSKQVLP